MLIYLLLIALICYIGGYCTAFFMMEREIQALNEQIIKRVEK